MDFESGFWKWFWMKLTTFILILMNPHLTGWVGGVGWVVWWWVGVGLAPADRRTDLVQARERQAATVGSRLSPSTAATEGLQDHTTGTSATSAQDRESTTSDGWQLWHQQNLSCTRRDWNYNCGKATIVQTTTQEVARPTHMGICLCVMIG